MTLADPILQNSRIILFDGLCNLCSGFVQFVYRRDKEGNFRFACLQNEISKEILNRFDLGLAGMKTIVLIESERLYLKSNAFLRIIRFLRFPWPLLTIGYILPRSFRDKLYDFVANNRYRWFGKKKRCMLPRGDLVNRFLP